MKMELWDKDPSRILFVSDYLLRDKDILMMVPGMSYRTRDQVFVAPCSWGTCQSARGIFGDRLEVGPKLAQWATNEWETRVKPSMDLRQATSADGDERLYDYQRAGVQWLKFSRRGVLGDDMGTGKTVQSITALRELQLAGEDVGPALVVAPNNMLLTWKKELAKWFPEATAAVIKGTKAKREKIIAEGADFFIINWEGVRGHSRLAPYGSVRLKRCVVCNPSLENIPYNAQSRCESCPASLNKIGFRTLVLDEAHRMKDPKAKQSRAVKALATEETEFIFALTGTPIADGPQDFWPALNMVAPEDWPARVPFIDRYCLTYLNPWAGQMDVMGLKLDTQSEFYRILDPRFRRMPKDLVLPFLPKKTYSTRYVEMTPKQAKAYETMAEQMVAMTDGGPIIALDNLSKLTRLSQFASAMAEVDENGDVKLTEPSNKVDALVELLEELGQEPAVVFSESRQVIELAAARLTKLGITYTMIVGGQTPDQREKAKDDFQAGKVRTILCTIKAAKEGITLTRAGTAIFLTRSWSPVDNKQAEDRVHRIGSEIHDKVNIIGIEAIGTVEEGQREALEVKAIMFEEIVRDRQFKEK